MNVFRGLIDLVETPEELLAVLAHEMSHVTLRHHLQTIAESIGLIVAIEILVGDVGGLVALGTEALRTVAFMSNSREHEHEADLEGVRMLHAAGIDPEHAVKMLESLPDAHVPLPWLRSHPEIDERLVIVDPTLDMKHPQIGRLHIRILQEQPLEPVAVPLKRVRRAMLRDPAEEAIDDHSQRFRRDLLLAGLAHDFMVAPERRIAIRSEIDLPAIDFDVPQAAGLRFRKPKLVQAERGESALTCFP